ncbi:MAG: hypothetical protein PHO54_03660, partial [Candidatus Peribacteraceae bacterium]|nr:hypothetical protein [Candidatus Peribacteraceae bacterium]
MQPRSASVPQAAAAPRKESASHFHRGKGLAVPRVFTTPGSDPLEEVKYEKRTSRIKIPDGSVVFEMEGAEV